ncbi:MAG: hypothetical protein AAB649_01480, partial [Patescibacteria group bacterium]
KRSDARMQRYIAKLTKESDEKMQRYIAKFSKESKKETQQYIAKLTKKSKEEIEQYVGAINEESKHNIEAVGEQYAGLNEKVDQVITTVGELNEKYEHTNVRLAGVEIELAEVRRIADATFEAVGNHEERITVLEEKVR